ncbi:MAG: flagellar hook-basal body complex protein FliE [Rhodanobacter sp.]
MSVMPIDAVSLGRISMPELGTTGAVQSAPSFLQTIGAGVNELNGSLNAADSSARVLAAGGNVSVQDVMIAMEQAHLQLQFAAEVRNRVVDAYQNLTNMQL